MFKPKSITCKWCGKHHYKGSKVARLHNRLLKKYGNKKTNKQKRNNLPKSYERTIYDLPDKIKYGYWQWKGKYFVEIYRKKKGKWVVQKRTYYRTKKQMIRKVALRTLGIMP